MTPRRKCPDSIDLGGEPSDKVSAGEGSDSSGERKEIRPKSQERSQNKDEFIRRGTGGLAGKKRKTSKGGHIINADQVYFSIRKKN